MSTKVKWETKKNIIPDMITELEILDGKKIEVGVFEGENAWLAAIHEYGCNITAKKAQCLTVPVNPKAKGKKASDFNDLFFYESESGEKFLVREKGKDSIEVLFWLTKSVEIPERAFLRNGHDENTDKVMKYADTLIKQVTSGKMTADKCLNLLGESLSTKIKTYARNLDNPSNWSGTSEAKGRDNPLVDTGKMINSIDWRIK
ncbi:MAG: hypothetical protein ACLT5F_09110 [Anaerotignaceae bacterium]|mgnify:CR=1 FL=1